MGKYKSNLTNKMLIVIAIITIALTMLWVRERDAYEGGMSISQCDRCGQLSYEPTATPKDSEHYCPECIEEIRLEVENAT